MNEDIENDECENVSKSVEQVSMNASSTETFGPGMSAVDNKIHDSDSINRLPSSPVNGASTDKWSCQTCTYENFPLSQKCTMCRSPRQPTDNNIIYNKEQQHTAAAGTVCERLQPLRISSPPPSGGVPHGNKWSCSMCTYENWPKAMKCAMCGTASSNTTHTDISSNNTSRSKISINEIVSQQGSVHETRLAAKRKNIDWLWLQACLGVVEGSVGRVESYLSNGGDPARVLTEREVRLLERPSAFDVGHTLVHLAIRFQREDILSLLLSRISGGGPGLKRAPSYIAPDLASAIRRHVVTSIRHKKGSFPCRYMQDFVTFTLPAEIEDLPSSIQEQLFTELLDRDAQRTLEVDHCLINWSLDITARLGSRLYVLWNRSAGDCLLDAVLQASWGVFDRDNSLRAALADSLHRAHRHFYERWESWECLQAALLNYAPDENQLRDEWNRLLAAAEVPGTPLHQLHVFVLAHIMRRPIIVYGVDIVNSFRGDPIGYANFQGVYLPLLWEPEFCSKSPLCVGYTRGHFSALVPMEPVTQSQYICRDVGEESEEMIFLPLSDAEGKLLPVHFLNCDEVGSEEALLRRWMMVVETGGSVGNGGIVTAAQIIHQRPLLVAQMLEEWLNHYRRLAQQNRGPFPPRVHPVATATQVDYSSDGDTDDE